MVLPSMLIWQLPRCRLFPYTTLFRSCPATQAFGDPEAGGCVLVVCTGKVADDPDKSTFPVKVFLPVNVLSVIDSADVWLRVTKLVCSAASARCARLVSAAIEAPSIAS